MQAETGGGASGAAATISRPCDATKRTALAAVATRKRVECDEGTTEAEVGAAVEERTGFASGWEMGGKRRVSTLHIGTRFWPATRTFAPDTLSRAGVRWLGAPWCTTASESPNASKQETANVLEIDAFTAISQTQQ